MSKWLGDNVTRGFAHLSDEDVLKLHLTRGILDDGLPETEEASAARWDLVLDGYNTRTIEHSNGDTSYSEPETARPWWRLW